MSCRSARRRGPAGTLPARVWRVITALCLGAALGGCSDEPATSVSPGTGAPGRYLRTLGEGAPPLGQLTGLVPTAAGGYWVVDHDGRIAELDRQGFVIRSRWVADLLPPPGADRRSLGLFHLDRAPDGSLVSWSSKGRLLRIQSDLSGATLGPTVGRPVEPDHLPIGFPTSLDVGPGGATYLAWPGEPIVLKVEPGGEVLSVGRQCADSCGYEFPSSLVVGEDGSVYVLDREFNRVLRYDSQGRFVLSFPLERNGSPGLDGLTVGLAPDGSLLVIGGASGPTQLLSRRFTPEGVYLGDVVLQGGAASRPSFLFGAIRVDSDGGVAFLSDSQGIVRFAGDGSPGPGFAVIACGGPRTDQAVDVVVSPDGFCLVRIRDRCPRTLLFDASGVYRWETPDADPRGRYVSLLDQIALTSEGHLVRFDRELRFALISEPGGGSVDTLALVPPPLPVEEPLDVCADPDGGVVILTRIARYAEERREIWAHRYDRNGTRVARWSVPGRPVELENGQISTDDGVQLEMEASGVCWVLHDSGALLSAFSAEGAPLHQLTLDQDGPGLLRSPVDFHFDESGRILISNFRTRKIHRYARTGAFLDRFATESPDGGSDGYFSCGPERFGVDRTGRITVIACNSAHQFGR